MKCPYQTKTVHQPEYTEGCTTYYAKDTTVFLDCLGDECPLYYRRTICGTEFTEHCRRAEKEGE